MEMVKVKDNYLSSDYIQKARYFNSISSDFWGVQSLRDKTLIIGFQICNLYWVKRFVQNINLSKCKLLLNGVELETNLTDKSSFNEFINQEIQLNHQNQIYWKPLTDLEFMSPTLASKLIYFLIGDWTIQCSNYNIHV